MNRILRLFSMVMLTLITFSALGQKAKDLPEFFLQKNEAEKHLRFLASDELQGRRTSEFGNDVAARYIAEQFRAWGLKPIEGADEYFQPIPFVKYTPAKKGSILWNDSLYSTDKSLVFLSGNSIDTSVQVVFANHGWIDPENGIDDYKNLDVNGKVVFVISGLPDTNDPYATFKAMTQKRNYAAERGALALIEMYRLTFPWQYFFNYFNKERLELSEEKENPEIKNLVYGWINQGNSEAAADLKNNKTVIRIKSSGTDAQLKPSKNVLGWIEGSDPVLKNQYILISAHYDHVGVGKQGGSFYTKEDSIFNGARDNGIGTVALLSAAKSFSQTPPKRSVIFLACTAEEIGLLGSKYYVDNPLIPLEKTIFNLNSDCAGYDDIEAISIIGYERVGVENEFKKAAEKFGLRIIADPAPEQNLFDRSDNVNFAEKGIPAPCISPGISGFTEDIARYYHQAADNPETLDYDYLITFFKTFSYMARLIADKKEVPNWAPGDKYEEAGKKLYGK